MEGEDGRSDRKKDSKEFENIKNKISPVSYIWTASNAKAKFLNFKKEKKNNRYFYFIFWEKEDTLHKGMIKYFPLYQ